MSNAIENLQKAIQKGIAVRPKIAGFPYLAEALREAGVTKNIWFLPSCQSLYQTAHGSVVMQNVPLIEGLSDVPPFSQKLLTTALRADQAGLTSFPEFLQAAWEAGCVRYDVDFIACTVTYFGCMSETYSETYPRVTIDV